MKKIKNKIYKVSNKVIKIMDKEYLYHLLLKEWPENMTMTSHK